MWSRKPTPVRRSPAPVPSRPELEVDPGLGGLAVDVSAAGHGRPFSRTSIDAACRSNPSARAIAAPGAASASAASPIRTSLMRRRKWRDVEPGGEARRAAGRAACGWSRRRSRRTPWRSPRRRTGSPARAHVAGRAPPRRRPAARGARARTPRRTRAPSRRPGRRRARAPHRVSAASASWASMSSSSAASSLTATASEPAPCSACASRSIATSAGVGALGGDDEHVARPGEAVDADGPGHQPLGLLDPEVPGPDDDVDPRDRSRCRSASAATRARRRRGRPRARRRARTRRGSRDAPPGAQTTTSSTPAACAVTTPMTTLLGYGARPPGT